MWFHCVNNADNYGHGKSVWIRNVGRRNVAFREDEWFGDVTQLIVRQDTGKGLLEVVAE